ncbi:hypothetical protein CFP56_026640 [Quercus suber]|uniref:Uncharacterized protein n=1 Tax=Quercus suber TaxID=58331 RepID=A0AAW0JZR3_QUESU
MVVVDDDDDMVEMRIIMFASGAPSSSSQFSDAYPKSFSGFDGGEIYWGLSDLIEGLYKKVVFLELFVLGMAKISTSPPDTTTKEMMS